MIAEKLKPGLTDVPETLLWTLHNRVSEARPDNGMLDDPKAVKIYDALDYDYVRSFGVADGSHAVRSAVFDVYLRAFIEQHPDAVIVNLGEGLETQRFRVVGDDVLWLSLDLPDAIAIRERFITPDEQHKHLPLSVLDRAWFGEVPDGRPVYITAQGLFMYFHEDEIRSLFQDLAERFPGAWLAFDTIPGWISRKTTSTKGWMQTSNYRAPRMPWGINRYRIEPTLREWAPTIDKVVVDLPSRMPRGLWRWLAPVLAATPILNRYTPTITRIRFGEVAKSTTGEIR